MITVPGEQWGGIEFALDRTGFARSVRKFKRTVTALLTTPLIYLPYDSNYPSAAPVLTRGYMHNPKTDRIVGLIWRVSTPVHLGRQ